MPSGWSVSLVDLSQTSARNDIVLSYVKTFLKMMRILCKIRNIFAGASIEAGCRAQLEALDVNKNE